MTYSTHFRLFELSQDRMRKEDLKIGPSTEEFIYSNTLLINIPMDIAVTFGLEKHLRPTYGMKPLHFRKDIVTLILYLDALMRLLRKGKTDTQYFISRHGYNIANTDIQVGALQLVLYGDLKVYNRNKTKFTLLHQRKELKQLLSLDYHYNSHGITCTTIQSRSQFHDVIRQMMFSHVWIDNSEQCTAKYPWPFYGWTNGWL